MKKLTLLFSIFLTISFSAKPQYFDSKSSGVIVNDVNQTQGTSWIDIDNDDDLDLYCTNLSNNDNFLYINDGNGNFSKNISSAIVSDGSNAISSAWGDYNNDRMIDVFVCVDGNNKLFINMGSGQFYEDTTNSVSSLSKKSITASWGDYDGDGWIDLFVANKNNTNSLYKNNAGTDLVLQSNSIVSTDNANSVMGTWFDYNNDNHTDLYVSNRNGDNNFLYKNNGNGTFTKITTGIIVNDGGDCQSISPGDYNNDGFMDLFDSNYFGNDNNLYKNNGNGTFTKIQSGPIVSSGGYSSTSSWIDIENDGDLDLIVGNSTTSSNTDNYLFINDGNGNFTQNFTDVIVNDNKLASSIASGDFDEDGYNDVSITRRNSDKNALFINQAGNNNWVNLLISGNSKNKTALNAKVKLKAKLDGINPVWQYREVLSSTGLRSQNSLNVEFGLGNANMIDSLVIRFTTGKICKYDSLVVNDFYNIWESCPALNTVSSQNNNIYGNKIKLFPNPNNTGSLYFDLGPYQDDNVDIFIYDTRGKLVIKSTFTKSKIDISSLEKGIYFVNIHIGKNIVFKKITKI